MKYCRQCEINIVDDTKICPLCQSVLDKTEDEVSPPMYPAVNIPRKKYTLFLKIFLFSAVAAMLLLALINYLTYNGVLWSAICAASIVYLLITLRYSLFNAHEGYTMKILVQSFGVMAISVLIDFIIGYSGWSFNYAIPITIMLVDMGILILMLVDMENWQNYILLQLCMLIFSILLLLTQFLHFLTHPVLSFIAVLVTVVLFLGTLIFGDRRAENELKRRFHI